MTGPQGRPPGDSAAHLPDDTDAHRPADPRAQSPDEPPSEDLTDPYLPRIEADPPEPAPADQPTSAPVERPAGLTDPHLVPLPRMQRSADDTDVHRRTDPPVLAPLAQGTPAEDHAWSQSAPPYDDADWLAEERASDLPLEPPSNPPSWWRRPQVLIPAAVLGVLLVIYGLDLLTAGNDIPRRTVVAGIDLGGRSQDQAERILLDRGVAEVQANRSATAGPVQLTVDPAAAGFALDVGRTLDAAADQPLNPVTRLLSLVTDREVDAVLSVDAERLTAAVAGYAEDVDITFVEGSVAIAGTEASIVEPVDGRTLRRDEAAGAVYTALKTGSRAPLSFPVDEQQARISAAQAEDTLRTFVVPALSAPVTLTGDDGASTQLTAEEIGAMLRFGPGDDGSLLAWIDEAALLAGIEPDARLFATPPVEATFDVTGPAVQIRPSAAGTRIDTALLAADLETVLLNPAPRGAFVAVVDALPSLTTEQAQAMGITEQVSTFASTYADGPAAQNMRLVAEAVDATLVRPGQSYSLNAGTGPRTAEAGYVLASAPGEAAAAIGEGVSPFATTMFNSVFFAGLEQVTHSPHLAYHTEYPAGRDATLRWDDTDLVWRNDSEAGIYVQTRWAPTSVSVTLWGTRVFDIEAVSGSQSNLVEPPSQTLSGPTCQTRSGSTGFDISITRVFRQAGTGEQLREQEFRTTYGAAPRILCAGEAAPPPAVEAPLPEPPVTIDPPPLPGTPTQTSGQPTPPPSSPGSSTPP
nr:VanW family protein [Geodermatophilaceae bacterium]